MKKAKCFAWQLMGSINIALLFAFIHMLFLSMITILEFIILAPLVIWCAHVCLHHARLIEEELDDTDNFD